MLITPEEEVPFGSVSMSDLSVLERARLACNTVKALFPDDTPASEEEKELARDMFTAITAPPKAQITNSATVSTLAHYPNASLRHLDQMLAEYDYELVNSSVRIREFTKNKLLLEAENPDGKIRIRALELLGKMKDVGLFTDRIEITHKTKTDDELELELTKKLEKYMGMAEVVDEEDAEDAEEILEPAHEEEIDGLLSRLEV